MQEPVYIAGPMSGYEDLNYPAFRAAEARLRELGHTEIENPYNEGDDPDQPEHYTYYLRRGLQQLLKCNSILMLPGWERSTGARTEHTVAALLHMEIKYLE